MSLDHISVFSAVVDQHLPRRRGKRLYGSALGNAGRVGVVHREPVLVVGVRPRYIDEMVVRRWPDGSDPLRTGHRQGRSDLGGKSRRGVDIVGRNGGIAGEVENMKRRLGPRNL